MLKANREFEVQLPMGGKVIVTDDAITEGAFVEVSCDNPNCDGSTHPAKIAWSQLGIAKGDSVLPHHAKAILTLTTFDSRNFNFLSSQCLVDFVQAGCLEGATPAPQQTEATKGPRVIPFRKSKA